MRPISPREVGVEELAERRLPDPRRHLEAFADERCRAAPAQSAGPACSPGSPRTNAGSTGSVSVASAVSHSACTSGWPLDACGSAPSSTSPTVRSRVVDGEALRHQRAHRVPDDHRRPHAEGVHERRDVAGEVGVAVAVGPAGVAVPALGDGNRPDRRRQVRQHRLERAPRVGDAVQEDHRRAVRIAALDVLERDAGGEGQPPPPSSPRTAVRHRCRSRGRSRPSARRPNRDPVSVTSARASAALRRASTMSACASFFCARSACTRPVSAQPFSRLRLRSSQ